jgi:hypothetical protein
VDCRVKAGNGGEAHDRAALRLFRRAYSLATMLGMSEPEQPQQERYVETARERRIANAVLLFFLVLIVGGGIWLANAMFEQRRLDDCVAQGRGNCAPPIEAPAR